MLSVDLNRPTISSGTERAFIGRKRWQVVDDGLALRVMRKWIRACQRVSLMNGSALDERTISAEFEFVPRANIALKRRRPG
jgi:hypothetical protein